MILYGFSGMREFPALETSSDTSTSHTTPGPADTDTLDVVMLVVMPVVAMLVVMLAMVTDMDTLAHTVMSDTHTIKLYSLYIIRFVEIKH